MVSGVADGSEDGAGGAASGVSRVVLAWQPSAEEVALVASLEAQWRLDVEREIAEHGDWPWEDDVGPEAVADDAPELRHRDVGQVAAATFAEALAAAPGGVRLAGLVDGVDLGAQDEYALVEVVAAWSRVVAWAQGRVAACAAVLADRVAAAGVAGAGVAGAGDGAAACGASGAVEGGVGVAGVRRGSTGGRGARGRPSVRPRCSAAHELAVRLCVSRDAAQRVVETGRALGGPLAMVGGALETGEIDLPRARAFVVGLGGVALPVAVAVADEVLPRAGRRTARQVARDIAEALIRVDEAEATRRHRRAREGRCVHRPVLLPDGMAGIWAVLPALDAVALDTALDGAAAAARAAGDPRSPDQVRADALAAVGHAALAQGWIGAPAGVDGRSAGVDGQAAGADGRPVGVDGRPVGVAEGFPIGAVGGRRAQVRVTVPLSVLVPGDDGVVTPSGDAADPVRGVAELDGYGPVTPDVARAIALGGVWTRLVTDPLSGVVRDVGRTRYRPPAELAELVRARDRTCVVPGCGAPARGCQLDHTVPYHLGGATSESNLASLCPAHHALKSAGVGRVRSVAPGVYEHELPSGHRYRREADGSATPLRRAGSSGGALPDERPPRRG